MTEAEIIEVMARVTSCSPWKDDEWHRLPEISRTNKRNEARKALAFLSAHGMEVVDGWQPIETAPRDETIVLLYCPDSWDTKCVRVGWWFAGTEESDDAGWYDDESASHPLKDIYGEPTHWKPSPGKP